jgi:hypothetical protein
MTLSAASDATEVTGDAFSVVLTHGLGTSSVAATVTVEATEDPGDPYSVTSVVPSFGDPDETRAVTITGTGFASGATVAVGGTAATSVVVVNATTITCVLPAKALGTYDLTVTQTEGVATLVNGVSYGAVPFFADNLEGGTPNPANGFTYSYGQASSTDGHVTWTVSDEYGFDGATHSFRGNFKGVAAGLGSAGGTGEIKFDMGREVDDVWVEYKMLFPLNYYHRNNYIPGSPPVGVADNNKFFAIWAGLYSSGYQQLVLETNPEKGVFSPADEVAAGPSRSRPVIRRGDSSTMQMISPTYAKLLGPDGTYAGIYGEPVTVRIAYKKASAHGVSDGYVQWWFNGVPLIANPVGPWYPQDAAKFADGLAKGYFMGANNSGFDEDTIMYLGAIKFYDTDPGWT